MNHLNTYHSSMKTNLGRKQYTTCKR